MLLRSYLGRNEFSTLQHTHTETELPASPIVIRVQNGHKRSSLGRDYSIGAKISSAITSESRDKSNSLRLITQSLTRALEYNKGIHVGLDSRRIPIVTHLAQTPRRDLARSKKNVRRSARDRPAR